MPKGKEQSPAIPAVDITPKAPLDPIPPPPLLRRQFALAGSGVTPQFFSTRTQAFMNGNFDLNSSTNADLVRVPQPELEPPSMA